jgi:lysophospholipase
MDLVGIESNPVPNGAISGSIVTSDRVNLRFARWRPTSRRVQGTVCLFQGRAEQIERYFEVIGDLRRRGFAIATLDWRGQGGSDRRLRNRRKGHVDSFSEYDRDLDAFMQSVVLPDCPPPHFALAHSTGALICLRAARANRARFARMVLTSPLAGLGEIGMPQARACRFAAILTALGFGELDAPRNKGKSIENQPFEGNPFTSDPLRYARNVEIVRNAPQLAIGSPTIGWVYAACRAIREAADPDFGPSIKIPVLSVAAALDKVVSVSAIETLVSELRAGAQVVISGAQHELMMERDAFREQFWAAFDAFVPGSRTGDGAAQSAI